MGISNWEWNHSCCIISPTEVQYSSRQGISKKGQERMEIKYQNISESLLRKGWSKDLFATRVTTQRQAYFSWRRDHSSQGTDAFLQSWTNLKAYAFPSFAL